MIWRLGGINPDAPSRSRILLPSTFPLTLCTQSLTIDIELNMSVYVIVDESDPHIDYTPTAASGPDPVNAAFKSLNGWCIACLGECSEYSSQSLSVLIYNGVFLYHLGGQFLQTSTRSSKALSTMSYDFNGARNLWAKASSIYL